MTLLPQYTQHIPRSRNITLMFIRQGEKKGGPLTFTVLNRVQSPEPLPFQVRGGEAGEQTALVLVAPREAVEVPIFLSTGSSSAPRPRAGSYVNGLPPGSASSPQTPSVPTRSQAACVLQRPLEGDAPSPSPEREGSRELVGYGGLSGGRTQTG